MSPPAAPPASASELTPPAPERVERFRRDLEASLAHCPPRHRPAEGAPPRAGAAIALAVSGGADSMAMLLLAAAAFPGRVMAATVDHGLRAEAADEAALVAATCARLGVPHRTLAPLAPIAGNSIQNRARAARYAALEAWLAEAGARLLLTAHHADDQAETLLMRLNRASGTSGLSGIRPCRRSGDMLVLRPLLRWRRRELREIVRAAGIDWVEDPSNADPRHDRTRYRAFLGDQSLLSAGALAAAAAHIAETDAALAEWVERLWTERWNGTRLDAAGLPREVRRRLARRAVLAVRAMHGVTAPRFSEASNVEPLLDALEAGRAATQSGILITPRAGAWRFTLAPARRSH
jgi:tRNA(Ile)-lysidine synthase